MSTTGAEIRQQVRQDMISTPTSGLARGYVQANLVVLPADWAYDFLVFAQRNPKPCPVLEVGDIGDCSTKYLAKGADIRTDIPRYRIYRNGELDDERSDIIDIWRGDFVYFLIGCSFTFEQALLHENLEIRHITENVNVPMYITNLSCKAAGRFPESPVVVSMRPFKGDHVQRAADITREYPAVHGSPIHSGEPAVIGISDIHSPDFGDPVSITSDDTPVFWACGVTPQIAAMHAKPPIMITHAPGFMFVGDMMDHQFRI